MGEFQNPWDAPGKTLAAFKHNIEKPDSLGYLDKYYNPSKREYKIQHIYYDDNGVLQNDGSVHIGLGLTEDLFNDSTNFMLSRYTNPSILAYGGSESSKQYYSISIINNNQVQVYTDSAGTVGQLPPFRPMNFTGELLNCYPQLSWSANTEPDINHYEIWKRNSPGGNWSLYTTTTNNDFTDENNQYPEVAYKIRAVDDDNNFSVFTPERTLNPGVISTNSTWSGNFTIRFNVNIASGVTLTVSPGSEISFTSSGKITADGNLAAQGTSSQGITFKSSSATPSPGNWYGIRVNGSANLSYCTVQHATYGVYYYTNANGTINQSNLQYNTYGIYAYQSSPNIQNCQIHHNNTAGIKFYSANNHGTAQITGNCIYNSSYGMHLQLSSPDIRDNQIYSNSYGVYCVSSSSPHLGEIGYYGENGIESNPYGGIYATSSCNPQLGEAGCQVNGGNNQIKNSIYYLGWADYYSNVKAENNWWGSNPPQSSKFHIGTGSSFDYTPYLTSQPAMGLMAGGSPEEEAFDQAFGSDATNVEISAQDTYSDKWALAQKLDYARSVIYLGDIPFAVKICKEIIETCPDSALAFFALDIFWEASRHEKAEAGYDLKSFQSYLEELILKKEKKELYGYSKIILADFDTKNSLMYFDQVYNDYNKSFLAEVALYHKFSYYYNAMENMDEAEKVYTQMQAKFPASEFTKTAGDFVGSSSGELFKAGSNMQLTATTEVPAVYNLYHNYPNPFNPSTTIRYALPKTSSVQVAIYNLLGQRIRSFSIHEQNAGNHSLVWNGFNEDGAAVSGGVYILRFQAESLQGDGEIYQKSLKMLMLR
jgi:hypothetical protein